MPMNMKPEPIRWPPGFAPGQAPIHIVNQLAMSASPAAVWAQLIRAADWPQWYDKCADVRIEGSISEVLPALVG